MLKYRSNYSKDNLSCFVYDTNSPDYCVSIVVSDDQYTAWLQDTNTGELRPVMCTNISNMPFIDFLYSTDSIVCDRLAAIN